MLEVEVLTVSKSESYISSKKKENILVNGRCSESTPRYCFFVVPRSLHESSRIFSRLNSALVGVDKPRKCETGFVGPA